MEDAHKPEWISLFGPYLKKTDPLLGGSWGRFDLKFPPASQSEDTTSDDLDESKPKESDPEPEESQESQLIEIIRMLIQLLSGKRLLNANK